MARKDKEVSPTAASYLGSLRSELDESADLDYNFIKLESAFGLVRSAYVSKKISATNAAKLFQKLYITSADNADWTLGSTTASWYRRDYGGNWVHSTPPIGIVVDTKKLPAWVTKGIESDIEGLKIIVEDQPVNILETITDVDLKYNKEFTKKTNASLNSYESYQTVDDSDWINLEWELTGSPTKPEVNLVPTSEDLPVARAEAQSPDSTTAPSPRDGYFNPEDFFLKDE